MTQFIKKKKIETEKKISEFHQGFLILLPFLVVIITPVWDFYDYFSIFIENINTNNLFIKLLLTLLYILLNLFYVFVIIKLHNKVSLHVMNKYQNVFLPVFDLESVKIIYDYLIRKNISKDQLIKHFSRYEPRLLKEYNKTISSGEYNNEFRNFIYNIKIFLTAFITIGILLLTVFSPLSLSLSTGKNIVEINNSCYKLTFKSKDIILKGNVYYFKKLNSCSYEEKIFTKINKSEQDYFTQYFKKDYDNREGPIQDLIKRYINDGVKYIEYNEGYISLTKNIKKEFIEGY